MILSDFSEWLSQLGDSFDNDFLPVFQKLLLVTGCVIGGLVLVYLVFLIFKAFRKKGK